MNGRDLGIKDKIDIKEPEDIEANFYYALGHEIRRKIIKIIGDNDFSSFTHLKRELNVSTGTIYHHLETLSQLIQQNNDKKYYLTELGKHAYSSLKDNIKTIITPVFTDKEFNSPILKGLMKVTPRKLIVYQENKGKLVMFISLTIILLGALFCGLNSLFPFLLFFSESILSDGLQVLFSIIYVANFLVYYLIVEGICRAFYKTKEHSIQLLTSFGIIFFPMLIYLIIHFMLFSLDFLSFIRVIDNILLILLQLWSLWLLTYNLSANKALKIENSLIVSLLLHYGGFSLFLLISI